MRNPVTMLAAHLMWTRSGTVWATWRLDPQAYGYRPDDDKHAIRDMHQLLLRALRGEALLLGLRAERSPESVVSAMIEGVDLATCPEWVQECEATLDMLEDIEIGQRTFWLCVPLSNTSMQEHVTEHARSAGVFIKDLLALPRGGMSQRAVTARLEQAADLQANLPSAFRPRPATVAEQLWIYAHTQRRGLINEPDLPDGDGGLISSPGRHGGAAIAEVIVDEGAYTDDEAPLQRLTPENVKLNEDEDPASWLSRTIEAVTSKKTKTSPRKRRYVKIIDTDRDEASYQAMVVLTGEPADGMVFPGSEYLGRVDDIGIHVDWAVRMTVRAREKVLARNRRAVRDLNDQLDQREGEIATGSTDLDRAAAALAEYQSVLSANELEVEIEPTVIFAVYADSAQQADGDAKTLVQHYSGASYTMVRPLGCQADLWWAMLPGMPTSRTVREFSMLATSRGFAAACPLTSTDLGDNQGALLAFNISTATPGIVLHDIAGASLRKGSSGSVAICGELGAGKSFLLKAMAGDVAARGGQWLAIDRSAQREWAKMARAQGDHAIVDVVGYRDDETGVDHAPSYSIDPLRLFGPIVGARVAQSFLIPLINATPTSSMGLLLAEVLDPDYLREHGIDGLGVLLKHLSTADLPGALDLARNLNIYAKRDFGRSVFDDALPLMPLAASAIVFCTQVCELPAPEELLNEHLFNQMKLEKIFGRAVYALIAAIARAVCFRDRSRLGLFVVDECHHVTASLEGERELVVFIREGRRALAALALGSHDPEADFGSPTLRGLIKVRILMRHTDDTLARRGLAWLDLDPNDEELVNLIRHHTSPIGVHGTPVERRGEALMRDGQGRIGRIKALGPALAERAAANDTTPGLAPRSAV